MVNCINEEDKKDKELRSDFANFFQNFEKIANFIETYFEESDTLKTPHAKNFLESV